MENSRQRFSHVRIQHHLQRKVIERIYTELQMTLPNETKSKINAQDDDEIDEEVEEGGYDDDDDMI